MVEIEFVYGGVVDEHVRDETGDVTTDGGTGGRTREWVERVGREGGLRGWVERVG